MAGAVGLSMRPAARAEAGGAGAASRPVLEMPDTTPEGKPHFDSTGAQVGEQIPDFKVSRPDGDPATLHEACRSGKVTLLLTSSFTCPRSRSQFPSAAALVKRFEKTKNVSLSILYVIEAHPVTDPSPYAGVEDLTAENRREHILCRQPTTIEQRFELAQRFQRALDVEASVYVDAMDNSAWKALGGGPNMGILLDRHGIVLARQGWFDAAAMEPVIERMLATLPDTVRGVGGAPKRFGLPDTGDLEGWRKAIKKDPSILKAVSPYSARGGEGGKTLLQEAVAASSDSHSLAFMNLLIESGADVNQDTSHEVSPLHVAAREGNEAVARVLIAHHAAIDARAHGNGPTPLQLALLKGKDAVARQLADAGAQSDFFVDVSLGRESAVAAAIEKDSTIIDRPDGWNNSPLVYAAASRQLPMARQLLKAGAKLETGGDSCLKRAVNSNDVAMVTLLCDAGGDPNCLNEAIFDKNLAIIEVLLAHKADADGSNIYGERPLHRAIMLHDLAMFNLLLKHGANPKLTTEVDRTPCGPGGGSNEISTLHMAAGEAESEMAAILVQKGVDPMARDVDLKTPLHYLAGSDADQKMIRATLQLLLDARADINAEDTNGQSPLDMAIAASKAASQPTTTVIDLLKANGAKVGSHKTVDELRGDGH